MAKLLILSGKRKGAEIELPGEGEVVDIGNRDSAKLAIHDPWISFNHAQIKLINGRYLIEDQGSSNGTWVLKGSNAERVERHELASEDVFALGNTRVRFLAEGRVAPQAAPAADDGAETPWWDKVIEQGNDKGDGQRVRLLKRELAEEKRMRKALEKFLDLPVGATFADAAKAGELEQRVRELENQLEQAKESAKSGVLPKGDMLARHTQKLRRGHMSEVVTLEGRATTAEAKVAELEKRLRERTESAKKERSELDTEVDRLKHELDELKAKGGGTGTVDEKLEAMTEELNEARKALSAAEAKRDELETQLKELQDATVDKSDLEGIKAELKAALEQVAHHKSERDKVVQELDDLSMEQIEIEDQLNARIKTLEAQLRDAGVEPKDDASDDEADDASDDEADDASDDEADDASDDDEADDASDDEPSDDAEESLDLAEPEDEDEPSDDAEESLDLAEPEDEDEPSDDAEESLDLAEPEEDASSEAEEFDPLAESEEKDPA